MGRVARYKKIKACDPFSKQNAGRFQLDTVGIWGLGSDGRKPKKRSLTAQKLQAQKKKKNPKSSTKSGEFDSPPDDETNDFELDNLDQIRRAAPRGSLQNNNNHWNPLAETAEERNRRLAAARTRVVVPVPSLHDDNTTTTASDQQKRQAQRALEDDREIHRALQLETQQAHLKQLQASMQRREGESYKAYQRRCQNSIQHEIRETQRQHPRQQRRLRKQAQKKLQQQQQQAAAQAATADDTRNNFREDDDDFDIPDDPVRFGEQAVRPPTLQHLPRGAPKKVKKTSKHATPAAAELERLRQQVQAQYALVRQKRQGQAFHL